MQNAEIEVSPEINVDLNSKNEMGNLDKFIELVDMAEHFFEES